MTPSKREKSTFRIAIVGAGPAGYFAAQALQNFEDDSRRFTIHMFEKLPTPWGLVRSGVAPDHPKIKSVSKVFEKIAATAGFRLVANIEVGRDVSLHTLRDHYDAVVIAIGTPKGRSLGIPGEELANVISSAEFVYWYNGHPHFQDLEIDLSGRRAIIIGAGNVAMDVGRMLALDPKELDSTDTSARALSKLHESNIREVSIVARRGAESASFTAPELRELPDLESIDVLIKEADISSAIERAGEEPEKHVRSNLEAMKAIAQTPRRDAPRSLAFLFEHKPVSINGVGKVESVTFDTPIGSIEIACDLVVTAIGYLPVGIDGLELDQNHYRNEDGGIDSGLFVVGWAKRGPTGVIGTNKSDASDVVKLLVSKLGVPKDSADLVEKLVDDGFAVVDQEGWSRINHEELRRGEAQGKPRVKVLDVEEMMRLAQKV